MTSPDPTSVFVTAPDGLRLHVRVRGANHSAEHPGRLPAVCLPGLTRTAEDFDVLARALANDPQHPRRVLALDYRGRGRSDYDLDPAHYAVPVEAGDVLAVLAALGAEPAVIVGTSRGGLIALVIAALRPQAIAGVVFNDIGPVIEPAGLARIKGYVGKMGSPANFAEAAALLRRLSAGQFPTLTEADWLAAAHRGFREHGGRLVPTYDPALARTLENFDPSVPLPALWREFDALKDKPVLVVRGANSDLLSPATVAEMQARHPALDSITVPDQGHAPLLAEPDVIARIAAFAARCDQVARSST